MAFKKNLGSTQTVELPCGAQLTVEQFGDGSGVRVSIPKHYAAVYLADEKFNITIGSDNFRALRALLTTLIAPKRKSKKKGK